MSLSIGIVGLPNVGKSTLFKLLTKKEVDIQNYPFCTIEPNTGIAFVPDERIKKLADNFRSKKVIPAVVKFVDIAGLVKGASIGEGLGNQFLSHIKETDAALHVVRCFESSEIIHTENSVNPLRDIDIINTELAFKDLEQIEKQLSGLEKEVRSGNKDAVFNVEILKEIKNILNKGESLQKYLQEKEKNLPDFAKLFLRASEFLTAKPIIYILNSTKTKDTEEIKNELERRKENYLIINIKEELEFSELGEEEKQELGFSESAMPELIKRAYKTLGLITFFTTGEDETRGWTVRAGTKAPEAAGKIHSDFEKKFIRAEVINWEKLLECGSYSIAKEKGLLRLEGKDYIVQDGDVVEIKHG